ncbi:hypothetical protein GMST_25250 [Geomonas silvestris]|uniref:DUF2147 domain-containing protein n=1 Tax=Geomonas silvestris TaxID=2740184 RepID=A0A6V8MJN8_9BACT|nr:DUF2147 domain-containing protein [Geomonas silvestris]GFO60200.1 hypothetical protein GMST_25250 [Geomonas silvestris]
MKKVLGRVLGSLPVLLILTAAAYGAADDILGAWKNEDGRAQIEIYHCDGKYCGRLAWLGRPVYPPDDPQGMAGKPRVDRENPDPKLKGRSLLGLKIMQGFSYGGGESWEHGEIYDPDSGKTYSCKMTLVNATKLKIRGYVGVPLFGRTTVWTRP